MTSLGIFSRLQLLCATSLLVVVPTIAFVPRPHINRMTSVSHPAPSSSSSPKSRLCAEKTATFGMGCFWAPTEDLMKVDGVLDCVAGYTGNPEATSVPNYSSVCYGNRWVEGVRVTYDDSVITYPQLLDAFFENQNPQLGSRQYASIIFVPPSNSADASQRENEARTWLEEGKAQEKARKKDNLPVRFTSIEEESNFYKAEGYHQNYWPKWRVRYGIIVGLLIVASGALNGIIPTEDMQSTVRTAANACISIGAVGALLERAVDAKVVQL